MRSDRLDVGGGDGPPVLEAQHVLQQHLEAVGQPRNVEALLERIEALNPRLAAYTSVYPELALAAARQNDRVGAVIFSEGIDRVVPPRKGRHHALRVLRDVLAFQPTTTGPNIAGGAACRARRLRPRGAGGGGAG